jgi:glycogen debranching enzyme
MSAEVLARLAARHLDLVRAPFTLPSSRLLVFRDDMANDPHAAASGIRIHTAEYEKPLDACRVIDRLEVRAADGRPRTIVDVLPDRIVFDGGASLTYAGPTAVSVAAPNGAQVAWTLPDGTRDTVESPAGDQIAVRIEVGRDRSVMAARSATHDADQAATSATWREWFERCPIVRDDLQEMTAFCWWVLGANIVALPRLGDVRAVVPSKIGYVGLWQWDAYFIATGLRHGDPALAREQLDLALRFPTSDGQLPDVVHEAGTLASSDDLPAADREHLRRDGSAVADADAPIPLTKPPLTAWAVRKLLEVAPDDEWARKVLPVIERSQDWWFAHSDADGDGMPEYAHPYSSGLDDSPIFDGTLPIASPDLGAYLVLQDLELAELCEQLNTGDPLAHRRRAHHTMTLLRRMWHPEQHAFLAGSRPTDAVVGLMPLLTGMLSPDIVGHLTDALSDPARYGTPWGLPTVAVDDSDFSPERMWRGPVWINTNVLVAEGLERSGLHTSARRLREHTVRLVIHGGGPHEYFNPRTGQKARAATTAFGWSAALFVDLAVRLSA